MPKVKRTWFVVSGSGTFPYDMLRYDECWPTGDTSELSICSHDPDYIEKREISMCTESSGPTVDRWRSFGWSVSKIESTYNL